MQSIPIFQRCVVPWEYASWPELLEDGWVSVGAVNGRALVERIASAAPSLAADERRLFGDGSAGHRIVAALIQAA